GEGWIGGGVVRGRAIERLTIEGTKGHVEVKPGHKVRVADEGLAERDEIGASMGNGFFGATFVEAVIGHEESVEEPLDREIVKRWNGGAARIALDYMEIGETPAGQCSGDLVKQALWIV